MKNFLLPTLSLVAAIGFSGCEPRSRRAGADADASPIPVLVRPALQAAAGRDVSVSGNVEGNKTVRLGFMVGGKLKYVAGEEGAVLKRGQLLASLDPDTYKFAGEMADANLAQTRDEYKRLQALHESRSVSESDFAKAANALKAARAQQGLQARNLSETKLFSPIAGVL